MNGIYRDPVYLKERIVAWIRDRVKEAGARGAVFGLSGGLDSSVLALLAKEALGYNNILGVIMPCESQPEDADLALMLAKSCFVPVQQVDLTPAYRALLDAMPLERGSMNALAMANIKPRLRMTTLYFFAQNCHFLVCGASNRDELELGYFTKHGDSGVDLLPMGDLLKGEVRLLAGHLGVPAPIISRPPSAGLWPGQTDEGELGATYDEIDRYLVTGEGDERVREIVERARRKSEHKRKMPPICKI
ncbi:MAG TPA: NAD(+) synthase [Acetomicrobium flavidum]|uniref:NH(3)-dependent NAD(+) synthetase n=1 Tax=Acetomicrobium flavidum TaxID=49896 RepID=A0ABY1JBC8_9BACT|nr:NAD+ synthase [Acetomicrobium flavidum]HOP87312.1 NAD(+) synthase [Acetomicrobium flavidum]